jgi:hypothetical protein
VRYSFLALTAYYWFSEWLDLFSSNPVKTKISSSLPHHDKRPEWEKFKYVTPDWMLTDPPFL